MRDTKPTRRSVSGQRRASVTTQRSSSTPSRASRTHASARPATAKPPQSEGIMRFFPLIALALGAILIALGVSALVNSCSSDAPAASKPSAPKPDATVSFVAVGDNLPENVLGNYAYTGDGHYDYKPLYEFIKPLVEPADVAYVKEEVHLDDNLGVHGYPSFNAPESLADDLISVGFDVVGSATNHIYDWGYFGACARNREVWNSKNVVFAGTNLNAEEAETIATFERNGITFAFLDYTYGVNGYDESDLNWWEVNYISEDRLTKDINRAHELAEVVIVAMHWGTENFTGVDDYQAKYAKLLADLNVDLVLGSHPHVIGPVDWLEGTDGHRTLVAYSLGNFVSHHDYPDPYNELEGMISCNFVRKNGTVTIENAIWTPLVNHTDDANNYYRIYPVKDYTNELASGAAALWSLDDAVAWLQDASRQIVGDKIAINDGR